MKKISRILLSITLLLGASGGELLAKNGRISPGQALEYFQEADAACRADNGRLWGVSLSGGLLLVDPETRIAYANQPDPQGRLARIDQVLGAKIPTDVNLANTALEWAGAKWSMILLPLPKDRFARTALIVHELWHGVQDRVGLPSSAAQNQHLDSREGRYWLQLEWRGLAAALAADGGKRAEAVTDAALFRAQRRALFPGSGIEEDAMEMHEGLAEYTGVKMCGAPDLAQFVIDGDLKNAPEKETFVRSFAYATGPAYGLLLDATDADWRKGLRPTTDLAALLLKASGLKLPADISATAEERAKKYDGANLAAKEDDREQARQRVVKDYQTRLVDGPILQLPLRNMRMEFDPGNLVPLESLGTIYPHIRIVDDWGILEVTSAGALLNSDFTLAVVAQPTKVSPESLAGNGWTLELKPGWSVVHGPRKGDSQLKLNSSP